MQISLACNAFFDDDHFKHRPFHLWGAANATASNPANVFTLNPFIGNDNLTINIYNIQTTGNGFAKSTATAISSGSAALLIIILLLINLGARTIANVSKQTKMQRLKITSAVALASHVKSIAPPI